MNAELRMKNEELGMMGGKMAARKHAEEALRLARCEGGEYVYKVAVEEAERMMK